MNALAFCVWAWVTPTLGTPYILTHPWADMDLPAIIPKGLPSSPDRAEA